MAFICRSPNFPVSSRPFLTEALTAAERTLLAAASLSILESIVVLTDILITYKSGSVDVNI